MYFYRIGRRGDSIQVKADSFRAGVSDEALPLALATLRMPWTHTQKDIREYANCQIVRYGQDVLTNG